MACAIYGISNCDTMRKARKWLDQHGIEARFHDYRKDGIRTELLGAWCKRLGWQALINRSGATWRQLPQDARNDLGETAAVALMLAKPALIKRPVLEVNGIVHVGFSPEAYRRIFFS